MMFEWIVCIETLHSEVPLLFFFYPDVISIGESRRNLQYQKILSSIIGLMLICLIPVMYFLWYMHVLESNVMLVSCSLDCSESALFVSSDQFQSEIYFVRQQNGSTCLFGILFPSFVFRVVPIFRAKFFVDNRMRDFVSYSIHLAY